MYKISYIQQLSDKLEAGEISPSDCLARLSTLRDERQALKERCEAILQIERETRSRHRAVKYDLDPLRNDAMKEIHQAWQQAVPYTKANVIENIKYTKAYESGLIDESKLNNIGLNCGTLTDLIKQFRGIIK